MFQNYPLIPVHYIAQINDYLLAKNIKTQGWLHLAGLTYTDVIEDSVMLEYPVYEKLILSAIELAGEDDIGLNLGKNLSIYSHGALSFALLNCTTVNEVLALFARYLSIRTPLLKLNITQTLGEIKLQFTETFDIEPIRRCFMEVLVVTFGHLLREILPDHNLLLHVAFPFDAPSYAASYRNVLDSTITFSQPCLTVILNNELLNLPLPSNDQQSLFQAKRLCEQELEKVNQLQSLSSRVRLLLMNSRENFLNLNGVADKLNLTPRTLHRRLESEGSSFQQILEEVRHSLAKQYLLQQRQSVKQVAFLLGYADVANFRRAFKRWQGLSPSDFRLTSNDQ